ncbi:MAG: serine O-acetyltransferase [Clostridia bacterium]|nr:serine O-acetyltransferase [Clostridia bacterium]
MRVAEGAGRYISFIKKQKACFDEYINNVKKHDPAATGTAEIVLLYSGVHAVAAHRIAHRLHKRGYTLAARAISQAARAWTGIEIHPGATIGKCLFIDHGMGVVIGETTVIGDYCTIYQGVTLGGTGKDTGKRHPTLGNRVMVGAGAKVLGPFKVGDGAKIAAGAVVLCEVPEDTTAVGIPAKPVCKDKKLTGEMDHIHIPDPVSQMIRALEERVSGLEKLIDKK